MKKEFNKSNNINKDEKDYESQITNSKLKSKNIDYYRDIKINKSILRGQQKDIKKGGKIKIYSKAERMGSKKVLKYIRFYLDKHKSCLLVDALINNNR